MRPRIRTIKPEFWHDEKIVALSRDARLLLLGLVTMADDEGRFRARRSTIIGHVFPDDEDAFDLLDGWISEIKEQKIIVFYVAGGTPYGAFRHWRRHQKINRAVPSDLPPPPDPKVSRANRVVKQGTLSESSVSIHGALSESSVSTTGNLTEKTVRTHASTRRRAFRSDPILILSLCKRLASHVSRNDPKAKPKPESEKWQTDMRLLVEDRDGDHTEVERVIDWCQADPFWRSNVLSPGKLRKQFTQLVLKAGESVPAANGTAPPSRRERLVNDRNRFIDH